MRTRSYAARANVNIQSTRRVPRYPRLAHEPHRLEPAEDLLDAFPPALARGIAAVAGDPAIDRAGAVRGVLGHMRGDAQQPDGGDEIPRVFGPDRRLLHTETSLSPNSRWRLSSDFPAATPRERLLGGQRQFLGSRMPEGRLCLVGRRRLTARLVRAREPRIRRKCRCNPREQHEQPTDHHQRDQREEADHHDPVIKGGPMRARTIRPTNGARRALGRRVPHALSGHLKCSRAPLEARSHAIERQHISCQF
jgi:hypothetical protein